MMPAATSQRFCGPSGAGGAAPAVRYGGEDDVVARLDQGHTRPDRLDEARPLVAADHRRRERHVADPVVLL